MNIVTGWAEVLRTPEAVAREDGALAGMSVGVVKGLGRAAARTLVGAFEVGTFFLEIPKDYAPIFRPEFVWAHGDWAP